MYYSPKSDCKHTEVRLFARALSSAAKFVLTLNCAGVVVAFIIMIFINVASLPPHTDRHTDTQTQASFIQTGKKRKRRKHNIIADGMLVRTHHQQMCSTQIKNNLLLALVSHNAS